MTDASGVLVCDCTCMFVHNRFTIGLHLVYMPFCHVSLMVKNSEDRRQRQARERVLIYGRRLTTQQIDER